VKASGKKPESTDSSESLSKSMFDSSLCSGGWFCSIEVGDSTTIASGLASD